MLTTFTHRLTAALLALPMFLFASSVWAQGPGRGATADFEVGYLQFIINHHYAALRLTEIAAGTAEIRQAEITTDEGVSPTPNSEALEGRAELDAVRSLARKVNRRNREGILAAQSYLRDWYGVEYSPQLTAENESAIQSLEQSDAGGDFDQNFIEALSVHHYQSLTPTVNCIVGRDIMHDQLYRFCKGILETQLLEIEDVRELLSTEFGVDDFQPFAADEDDGSTNGEDTTNGGGATNGGDDDGVPPANNTTDGDAGQTEDDTAEPGNTPPEIVQ